MTKITPMAAGSLDCCHSRPGTRRGHHLYTKPYRRPVEDLSSLPFQPWTEILRGCLTGWRDLETWERRVIVREHSVVKRELDECDLIRLPNGKILYPFWPRERLRNEAATLKFIASETTIPVPDCRLYTKDGLLHLEMSRITNGVHLFCHQKTILSNDDFL